MIWVRLIGGECNGQVHKVDDDQRELTVTKRKPVAITSPRLSLAATTSHTMVSHYTRRSVRTPEGEVVFFADALMSDLQAVQSVLGP